jgi:hypothetical protein
MITWGKAEYFNMEFNQITKHQRRVSYAQIYQHEQKGSVFVLILRKIETKVSRFWWLVQYSSSISLLADPVLNLVFKDPGITCILVENSGFLEFGTNS